MITEKERKRNSREELDMIFFYILQRIIGYISGCVLVDLRCLVGGVWAKATAFVFFYEKIWIEMKCFMKIIKKAQ